MVRYELPAPPETGQVRDGANLTWTADLTTQFPYLWRREACTKCGHQAPSVLTWAALIASGTVKDMPTNGV